MRRLPSMWHIGGACKIPHGSEVLSCIIQSAFGMALVASARDVSALHTQYLEDVLESGKADRDLTGMLATTCK